jgi:DNA-binding NarL/FixJ family response regulator
MAVREVVGVNGSSAANVAVTPDGPAARATLHVLLADGDPLARRLLRDALRDQPDLVVVGAATNGWEAIELVREHRPHVLIMEEALPRISGIDVVRELAREAPETRIVMLCSCADHDVALQALQAGAAGFLSKDLQLTALPGIVRRVADGGAIVPPSLLPLLLARLREVPETGWRPVRSRLTSRQWEIIDLLAEGSSTDEIAERLVVSPATVYSHVKTLMGTLGVHTRRDAVAAAERLRRKEVEGAPDGSRGHRSPRLVGDLRRVGESDDHRAG